MGFGIAICCRKVKFESDKDEKNHFLKPGPLFSGFYPD